MILKFLIKIIFFLCTVLFLLVLNQEIRNESGQESPIPFKLLFYFNMIFAFQIRDFVQAGSQSGDWEPNAKNSHTYVIESHINVGTIKENLWNDARIFF